MRDTPTAPGNASPSIAKPARWEKRFFRRPLTRLGAILSRRDARAWAQPVTYIGVAMLVATYCFLAVLMVNDRDAATAGAIRQGDNLVRIIDESYSHIFQNVDSTLQFLGKTYEQSPSTFILSSWICDLAIKNALTFDFVIVGANGRAIDATSSDTLGAAAAIIGVDFSERDYFQNQINPDAEKLFISSPLPLKVSGTTAIVLSRRLSAPDGSFAGIVVALVSPKELGKAVAGIDLGPSGTFGLIGIDGIIRTRVIDGKVDVNTPGRRISPKVGVMQHAAAAASGHFWNIPEFMDGVSRLVSYRVLGKLPLIAFVAASEAEIFRHANEEAMLYWAIALMLTFVILVGIKWGTARERKLNDALAEMREAQASLRMSQERYRLVETAVNDGIWDKNILTDTLYFSPRWLSILGYAEDEIANTEAAFVELIHPNDKPKIAEMRTAYLAGPQDTSYAVDFRLKHKDGSYRWVQSRGKAIRDADGRSVRMLGTITDITERKRSEVLIEESLNDLARAESLALLGNYKYDIAANTFKWSDGMYRIFGKSPATFVPTATSIVGLMLPEDRPILEQYRRDTIAGLDVPRITLRAVREDGRIIYVEGWSRAAYDATGKVTGMYGTLQDVTVRTRVAAALKENFDSLERAERMAHLGHIKYEAATGAYTWSDGVYRIMGKSPETYKPDFESSLALVHTDDQPALAQHRASVLAGIELPPITLRTITDAGKVVYFEVWSTPLRDSNGSVTGMFGTVQDVTERRRTELAIKESRENLARAEAMALLGHTRTDRDGTYTWSAGVYRITGKSPETFKPTPENARELIHPDDRAAHDKYRLDALAGVEVPRKTVRMIRDDGQIIHVEFWSVPIRDKNGAVIGKFSTLQDVTALKRTEALIGESHTNLERAERMALLGHYKIDRGTGNLVWSSGIYRIFGLSPETFTPTLRSALELIHPDDSQALKKLRDEAMAGQENPHVTMRAYRSDGQLIDIEYWSTPVRDANGAVTGIFGTVQDITVRKRAEETLAQANQELEARVSERTAELAREMRRREEAQMTLGQMQKMEAVGQLTAGVAHDFNNLLAVIGGSLEFVDSAAARGLTAEPELIDAALRATRRGRELVRRLLAFSRQSPLRAEATTIDQLVLDTLRLLQRTLGNGIDMVTQLDAKAAVISVDRNQMANALLNLALNARDAMPEGGQLTIMTKCQPVANAAQESSRWPTGEEVCIVISDTGVGMTDDVRSRAFEPFFTTKPDGLGSGLGLSMVQGFVEQSGGKIDIESAPGNGTTITIRLPRVASESQADDTDLVTGVSASGREKTVLLVEDDPDVRVVTAAQLRQLGYKVHAVANGMEAIDLIASPANIDITLTDIVLPGGLDGVALIKEAMRARPKMGVLCMSGYNPTQKHRKWLKVQNINFLEKPFSSGRLAQALDAALAH